MKLNHSILNTIGNTPLVPLKTFGENLFAKVESFNPSGSIKDRMAIYIIEQAEKDGLLKPGGTIVENSSGNTGTALSMIAAIKGYKCIITMPDKMSREKQDLMRAYGAEVIVTPTDVPADSPESYYSVAKRIASETPGAFYPDQYNNPNNIEAHFNTTGPEIWAQTEGKFDIFVAGIGTGGTLSGCGRYFKSQNPNIKLIGVDPIGSVFYDYYKTHKIIEPSVYQVEGIGEDHVVKALDFEILDDIIQVNDKDAFNTALKLCHQEGIMMGGSSGAALWAAEKVAKDNPNKTIITVLPDSGNRYLSKIYNPSWMKEKGFV